MKCVFLEYSTLIGENNIMGMIHGLRVISWSVFEFSRVFLECSTLIGKNNIMGMIQVLRVILS
jgi:hypothetical protein